MRNKLAVAVINTILKKYLVPGVGFDITHTKLQKLVYFCHAEILYRKNKEGTEGLIPLTKEEYPSEQFYAYTYGPVMRSLYEEYKAFGSRKLDSYSSFEGNTNVLFIKRNAPMRFVIEDVLTILGGKEQGELVVMTHRDKSPWAHTSLDEVISDQKIIEYYPNTRPEGLSELSKTPHVSH